MPSFSREFLDESRRRCLKENGGFDDAFFRCLAETQAIVDALEEELAIERPVLEAGKANAKNRKTKEKDD